MKSGAKNNDLVKIAEYVTDILGNVGFGTASISRDYTFCYFDYGKTRVIFFEKVASAVVFYESDRNRDFDYADPKFPNNLIDYLIECLDERRPKT